MDITSELTISEVSRICETFKRFVRQGKDKEYWWRDTEELLKTQSNTVVETIKDFEFGMTFKCYAMDYYGGEKRFIFEAIDSDDSSNDERIVFKYVKWLCEELDRRLFMISEDIE